MASGTAEHLGYGLNVEELGRSIGRRERSTHANIPFGKSRRPAKRRSHDLHFSETAAHVPESPDGRFGACAQNVRRVVRKGRGLPKKDGKRPPDGFFGRDRQAKAKITWAATR
jgi:hypothetical protein